jgi:hypothetical protein
MKRSRLLLFSSIFLIVVVGFYYRYSRANFLKKNFTACTGIEVFVVKAAYSDDHQTFIETLISKTDKEKLLTKFQFENSMDKLKSRKQPSFLSENPNYEYCVVENSMGPLGYILLALEKDGNTLIKYEICEN